MLLLFLFYGGTVQDRVSLFSPGCPGTYSIGLELRDAHAYFTCFFKDLICICVHAPTHRDQKRGPQNYELSLQALVSYLIGLVGVMLRSPGRAVSTLNQPLTALQSLLSGFRF